ncbi:helix-turn-helix domain-containing protein [Nonomuraea sediminis]|uniref:helix-turn-helix domain-containing protein n=1 Tax=Nonomuraea sediminis TaxID=2835864 RepID=UPI001BDC6163|nr:helix-turn-helix domain-containing protein [Nonomuraea sediminis]
MSGGSSLARLLEAGDFTAVTAPRGLDVAITGPVLHDSLKPPSSRSGSVVLLVGVDPAAPGSAAVLYGLVEAAAVVVRTPACAEVAEAAQRAGVALLTCPLPWARVFALVEAASADRAPGTAAQALAGIAPGDLDTLADDAAALLGRPVMFVDPEWRLLAYSAVLGQWTDALHRELLLARAVPEREAPSATRRLLLAGNRALRFWNEDGDEAVWRIGAGVRSAGQPVGMLWVLEGHDQLPLELLAVIEEVARLSGPHVARHLAARTRDRERRGRLAGQAIDGRDAAAACRALGLDLSAGCAVVAVRAADGARVLDAVSAALAARRHAAACVQRSDVVYCILPGDSAYEVVAGLATDLGIRAGIGGTARDGAGLARSRRLAHLVLGVLEEGGEPDDATLRARVAVREFLELLAATPELLLHELPLAQEETALAWIEALGDAAGVAGRTGLHPNGVRYRIRRLAELGLDLDDPDTRLLAWLRLRLAAGQRPRAQVQVAGPAVARVADEGD